MASAFVTVVSGLPRSGTSLMMQMLAAGGMPVLSDGQRAADPDNPRGYLELEAVKRTRVDSSWLREAPGKAVKVVHILLRDLPPEFAYRVILMRRDIREVLASQRAMLVRLGRPGAALGEDRMADLFESQIRATVDWLAGNPSFRTLEVDYAECVHDPLAAATRVAAFLETSLDPADMAAAVDVTLYRNRSIR
jgi:hypothetical protein